MTITAAELDSIIEDYEPDDLTEDDWYEGGFASLEDNSRTRNPATGKYEATAFSFPGVDGVIRVVDTFGGMDLGSDYWMVISLTAPDGSVRHFRKPGWYQSHEGGYYEGDLEEVRQAEKLITVWVAE